LVIRFWHVGGVKSAKIAYFENQHLDGTDADKELDEIVMRASQSGWRPMVRSVSRHSGEHVYVYAQDAGKDLKLLVVNVEPNEAEVIQVKVDPKRLEEFIAENTHHSGHDGMDGMMSFR
jgi:sulfite reductase alpha subunit-like flavoprotein